MQRIVLEHPAMSIVVTQDAAPVMVATDVTPKLEVYDALSGEHRRTIDDGDVRGNAVIDGIR